MLRNNNVHSAEGNLHLQWRSSSVYDGDVMVIVAKKGRRVWLVIVNQQRPACVGNSLILPAPRHLHYTVSSTFRIVSGFFITGMQNMPKACSSNCHLYHIKTSHFILMHAQGDRVHSQFRKEWRIPRVRGTARNCLSCTGGTLQHSINVWGFGRINSVQRGLGTYRRKPNTINCWVGLSRTIVSEDVAAVNCSQSFSQVDTVLWHNRTALYSQSSVSRGVSLNTCNSWDSQGQCM